LTYFIMLNFINQRAYFQRISYNFNEVLFHDTGYKICIYDKYILLLPVTVANLLHRVVAKFDRQSAFSLFPYS